MLDSTKTVRIVQENSEEEIVIGIDEPTNLLELLNANDISISQSCGGNGICTTCRVYVKEGMENLSERSDLEIERAEERNFKPDERLCCQTETTGNVTIILPEEDFRQ